MNSRGLDYICGCVPIEDNSTKMARHAPCAMMAPGADRIGGCCIRLLHDLYRPAAVVSAAGRRMQRGRGEPLCTHPRPAGWYYGVVLYLYMSGLAVLLAFDPVSRGLRLGAILCAGLGVLFSLYFMVLQVAFIRAFCIYCLISAVTTLLLAVVAAVHAKPIRAGRRGA